MTISYRSNMSTAAPLHQHPLPSRPQNANNILPPSPQRLSSSKTYPPRTQTAIHPSLVPRLDPAFISLYNSVFSHSTPLSTDIHVVRQSYSNIYRFATNPASGVGGIGETTVPGWSKYPGEIGVRVYVPPGEEGGERKVWRVHFNFHGGGWAAGDLETSAHICHHICARTPCCVIDIEYRLIPEYPFPIGVMDGLTAVTHILANHKTFSIDPNHITLGGESSGGTIALILNHLFRDYGLGDKVKGVMVGTPTISDLRTCATPDMSPWESMRELGNIAPLLNWEKLKWFDTFKWMSVGTNHPGKISHKEKKADVSWFADAMTAPDFNNLAPLTFVGTAEIDPLRDEAEAYAKKCEEAGNKVVMKRYLGVPNGFMHMDRVLNQGRDYVDDVIGHVRQCLHSDKEDVKEIKGEDTTRVTIKDDEEMNDAPAE